MKSLFRFRENDKSLTLCVFLFLSSAAFFMIMPARTAQMQNGCLSETCDKPITKQEIRDIFIKSKATVKLKTENVICLINSCNIDFEMNAAFESELRGFRAYKLIETIRKKQTENQKRLPAKPSDPSESSGIKFIQVPKGEFSRDSGTGETQTIVVEKSFWISEHEVTIGEWKKIMGKLPMALEEADVKFRTSDKQPLVYVSWDYAKKFIKKLNETNVGYEYRLPTEAEWEYAARAGTKTPFAFGDNLNENQANYEGTSTKEVCSYQPNIWNLCDMHGNAQEWVEDRYHDDFLWWRPLHGVMANTALGDDENAKVTRGGSWNDKAANCGSASRTFLIKAKSASQVGFRVVANFKVLEQF